MWFWWGGNVAACVTVPWMNPCSCLHGDKQIASSFWKNKKIKIIHPNLAASLKKSDQQWNEWELNEMFFFFFLIKESKHWTLLCTFHYASHTKAQQRAVIDPSAAALGAHSDFTLIDYFTINSSWLQAREASWGMLLFHTHKNHNENTRYTNATSSCSQTPICSYTQDTVQCTNAHPHCDCNVDNLSNEEWQVAAVWKLSSVRLCGLHTASSDRAFAAEITPKVWMQFYLNFLFLNLV